MKLFILFLLGFALSLAVLECEAGRRGGGSSRGSSSSGGWFGSSRKSSSNSQSSGSSWFSWGSKKKPSTNPQSSYPKQQWSNTGSQSSGASSGTNTGSNTNIGGGGWANTGNKGYGSNTGTNTGYGSNTNVGGGGWANTGNKGYGSNTNVGGGGWANTGNKGYGTNTGYGSNTVHSGNSIGGGGWANTGNRNYGNNYGSNYNGAFYQNRGNIYSGSNYNTFGYGTGRQNYGYYGGNLFTNQYRTTGGLFGGGKRSFALGAGAGFLGGAMAGVAAMSMYHQFRMYRTMLMYNSMGGGYHGYGYSYGHRRGMLVDEFDCVGGCPMQAFCDYGICRCRSGYDARYGQCWNRMEDFERNQGQWESRQKSDYNPYMSCVAHSDCRKTDMNMFCKAGTCQCREDMKWNTEALECQIFIDVNCTDVKEVETIVKNQTLDNQEDTFDDSFIYNMTDSDGNLNITEISADETLAESELTTLNPNETTPAEMKQAFCKDMARIARSYEQKLVPPPPEESKGSSISLVGIILLIIVPCCLCFCICKYGSKLKEQFNQRKGGGSNDYDMDNDQMGAPVNAYPNQQGGPYPPMPQQSGPYPPMDQAPYPPLPQQGGNDLPPLGPAIPPTQPGYPANPDPYANNSATPYPPLPPADGQLPYPTNPPPAYGANPPPYPPQPAYNPTA